jgi:hypothetical protein
VCPARHFNGCVVSIVIGGAFVIWGNFRGCSNPALVIPANAGIYNHVGIKHGDSQKNTRFAFNLGIDLPHYGFPLSRE